jgi:hypothetical protein
MSQRSARNDAGKQSTKGGERSPGSGAHEIAKQSDRGSKRDQASVQEYLDRFATAMTSGDIKTMAKLWGVPAFVIGVSEARVVQSEAEVEQFFGGAKDAYNERGICDTRAEITNLDWIGDDLVIATVRWPYLDAEDCVLGEESSSYTLLRGEDGSFKLRVITLRGQNDKLGATPTEETDGE